MSKSLGNYIGVTEPPSEMFGKVMSVSDALMWKYYELLTDMSFAEIDALRAKGEPMQAKIDLARRIVEDFHSKAAAEEAARHFDSVIRKKEMPDQISEKEVAAGTYPLSALLLAVGLAPSRQEAKRLIEQGAVSVDGERIAVSLDGVSIVGGDVSFVLKASKAHVLKVGKRKFVRIVVTG
jgi:tyrosyl-tRNA synthetase